MWKSKLLLLSTLALLSLSFSVQADVYDGVQVKTWDMPVSHFVMPSLDAVSIRVEAPKTIATYEMQANVAWVDTPRVFRDFRTIADSGGNRV